MTLPLHGFAAAVMELYGGQIVEINTGETSLSLLFDQENRTLKSLIRGRLVNAIGDALIVECDVPGGKKTIALNCWGITAISPTNEPALMKDCYYDEHSSRSLHKQ